MKKCALLFAFFSILLSGCLLEPTVDYACMHPYAEISLIEIVKNENYDRYVIGDSYEVLRTITADEIPGFITSILQVKCSKLLNDPGAGLGPVVIRITYCNGDVEMLGQWNTACMWSDGRKREYPYHFDKDAYYDVVEAYIGEEISEEIK